MIHKFIHFKQQEMADMETDAEPAPLDEMQVS